MILGKREYRDLGGIVNGSYNITDIYKKPDGTIDSYQVEVSMTPGTTYPVILTEDELLAVADNIPAAYQYIDNETRGRRLYSFLIGGADERYINEYCKLRGITLSTDCGKFHFRYFRNIDIIEYCNCMYQHSGGFNIHPRFVQYDQFFDEWKDNVWDGKMEPIEVCSYEQYFMAVNGLLWLDDNMVEKRNRLNDDDFARFLIRTFEENYIKAYEEARPEFEKRFEAFLISLNKEDDKDGKKEI
jgi:hypothetical protein